MTFYGSVLRQQSSRSPQQVYRCDCEAPLYCDCCEAACPTNDTFRTPTYHDGDDYHYHYCLTCADAYEAAG